MRSMVEGACGGASVAPSGLLRSPPPPLRRGGTYTLGAQRSLSTAVREKGKIAATTTRVHR
jgi:hypothetical protein